MNQATAFNYAYTVMLSLIKEIQERSNANPTEATLIAGCAIASYTALLTDETISVILQEIRLDPPPKNSEVPTVKDVQQVIKQLNSGN